MGWAVCGAPDAAKGGAGLPVTRSPASSVPAAAERPGDGADAARAGGGARGRLAGPTADGAEAAAGPPAWKCVVLSGDTICPSRTVLRGAARCMPSQGLDGPLRRRACGVVGADRAPMNLPELATACRSATAVAEGNSARAGAAWEGDGAGDWGRSRGGVEEFRREGAFLPT